MCVRIKSHENTFSCRVQMANSFFGFNNPLNEQEEGLHDDFDFDFEDEEEEYDALNDETFGADASEGDWEHDHEKLVEITEKSRVHHSSYNGSTDHEDLELEAALGQLVLDDINDDRDHEKDDKVKKDKSFKNNFVYSSSAPSVFPSPWSTDSSIKESSNALPDLPPGKTVRTVEELERQLISQSRTANQRAAVSGKHLESVGKDIKGKIIHNQESAYLLARTVGRGQPLRQNGVVMVRPFLQQAAQGVGILPRPMAGMGIPPDVRHLQQQQQNRFLVPASDFHLFPPPPPFVIRQHFQPPPCGRLLLGPYPRQGFHSPDTSMFRPMMHHNNLYNSGFRDRQYTSGLRHQEPYFKHRDNSHHQNYRPHQNLHCRVDDEYAGMMSDREKTWLQNIQQLQLNSSPPHIDDYYYTIFSSRQADKKNGENCRNRERRDSYNKDQQGTSKVYTPAQFENSLGKLQVGSVTAPRKIIDMDVVHQEGVENIAVAAPRDMRKLKQILLEVERLYLLLLQLEDLSSPMPELREAVQDSKEALQQKILATLLADDWFVNILSFHKGKKLFVRFLRHVTDPHQTSALWARLLGGLVAIVRYDPDGAGVVLEMFPFFSRWLQGATPTCFAELASSVVRAEEQRRGRRSILSLVLSDRFGVSVLAVMLVRAQSLYPSLDESGQAVWLRLLRLLVDAVDLMPENTLVKPLQSVDVSALTNHFASCGFELTDQTHQKLKQIFCPSL
ncbi:protein PAT1 homolog 1 [Bacillus rossius redtenbacheri]|uniref:protein PAT1 homolog 1 n=1 Tax=Bacillus rossius redtenbacheri TaxID=93214 RepID=UPI002FDD8CDE